MNDQEAHPGGREVSGQTRRSGWPGSVLATFAIVGLLCWLGSDRSQPDSGASTGEFRALLHGREAPVFSLAWSPDGNRLAVSGFGPIVQIWDRISGSVRSIGSETEQSRFVLGWAKDGRRLVLGGLEMSVDVREVGASRSQEEHQQPARPNDRDGDLRLIVEASRGGSIRLRGPFDWRAAWLPASEHPALSAAFSRDGRSIATAEVDHAVRIWDARSGKLRHTLRVDVRGTSSVAFSPDGSIVASGGGGKLCFWSAESGKLLKTLGGSIVGSAVIAFSEDGLRLAGATWDGTIRIWNVASGLEQARLKGHDGQVLSLAWSPDGRVLASGAYDSTVRLWDVAVPVEIARAP